MATTTADTRAPEFDEEGFLRNPDQWDRTLAQELARRSGIGELTERHWKIIETMRQFYFHNGAPPSIRYACDVNDFDPHCMTDLFGTHPIEAWRIAGLPNPGEEAKTYW